MAKITNDLKRIQRISSILIRTIEGCFIDAEIRKVSCKYYDSGEFSLEFDSYVFDFPLLDDLSFPVYLHFTINDVSAKECVSAMKEEILAQTYEIEEKLKFEKSKLEEIVSRKSVYNKISELLDYVHIFKKIFESIKI